MPYYSEPLTLRGVMWITKTTNAMNPVEGHVEFTMHCPDRDHCTMCYSREDTPEALFHLHADQLYTMREVVAMLLGSRVHLFPPEG